MALGIAALAAISKTRSVAGSDAPLVPLNYFTRCAVVESNSVDGFVTNASRNAYRARGEIRFVFSQPGGSPRPEALVQSDVLVPAGETVRVARARLAPPLRAEETCRLDVEAALRQE